MGIGAIQSGRIGVTFGHDARAAGRELAPVASTDRFAHCGCRIISPPALGGIRLGDGADQKLGIGVLWPLHHTVNIAHLRDRAGIKHDDVCADLIGGCQIMSDIYEGDPVILIKLAQSGQDGGAQRGVDHRYRLIGDDQLRLGQQRPRHHDALALAATELVRVPAEGILRPQPNGLQRPLGQRPLFLARADLARLLDWDF